MRKNSWMIPVLSLLIMIGLFIGIPGAKADINLKENGSVVYAWIQETNDLRKYIDQNGLYANTDTMDKSEYSNTYKIIIDEPGQLVIAPLSQGYAKMMVYSDFNLISKIAETSMIKNSKETFSVFHVDAGEYYYRLYNNFESSKATVFIGFIPDSGIAKSEWSYRNDSDEVEEIKPIPISCADELASYIDYDGEATNSVEVHQYEVSRTYQFTVAKEGTLVVAILVNKNSFSKFCLFSNSDLSSRLFAISGVCSSKEGMQEIALEPGTYYYNIYNQYSDDSIHVFLGFIEQSDRIDRYATTSNHENETCIEKINSIDELKKMVEEGNYTFKEKTAKGNNSPMHKFVLDETSLVLFCSTADKYGNEVYLYSDSWLNSRIDVMKSAVIKQDKYQIYNYLLDPGDYYIFSNNKYNASSSSVYIGFIPVSDFLSVEEIRLNDNKTAATVRFAINDAYNPDQMRGEVRVEKGIIRTRSIANKSIWKDETRENVIESHEFVATENGFYTARMNRFPSSRQ